MTHLTKDRPKSFKRTTRKSTKRSISASTKSSDDGGSSSPVLLVDDHDGVDPKMFLPAAALSTSTSPPPTQRQRKRYEPSSNSSINSEGGSSSEVISSCSGSIDKSSTTKTGRQDSNDSKACSVTSSFDDNSSSIETHQQLNSSDSNGHSDSKALPVAKENEATSTVKTSFKDIENVESKQYSYSDAKKAETKESPIFTSEQPSTTVRSESQPQQPASSSSKFNKGGFGRGSFRLPGFDELRGKKSLRKTTSSGSSKSSSSQNKEGSTPLLEETMTAETISPPLATSTLIRNKNRKNQAVDNSTPDWKANTKGGFFNRGGSVRLNKSENLSASSSVSNENEQHKPVRRSFSTGGSRSDVRSLRERLESGGNSLRSGISRLGSSVTSRTQPRIGKNKSSSVGDSEKLISEDPDENTDFLVKTKDDKKVAKEKEDQKQQLPPKEKRRIIGGQSAARSITSLKAQPSQPSYKKLDRGDSSDGPSQPSSPTVKSPSSVAEPLTEFYKPRSASPKLHRKDSDDDANALVLENKEVTTSKREWSLEERILWERQQLEESKKQYERSTSKNNNINGTTSSIKGSENINNSLKQPLQPYQQQTGMSHHDQKVIERNKKNLGQQQESKDAAEINNIMTDKEKSEDRNDEISSLSLLSSTKNILKHNNNTMKTHVVSNPQVTPQLSNNDKPLIDHNREATFTTKYGANHTKYGASDSIHGNSRNPSSSPPPQITDKFASSNKQHLQDEKTTISGWQNQQNIVDGVCNKDINITTKSLQSSPPSSQQSYNAVQVRKSFSIKALTPRLGRRNTGARKVDENGRILDKKGCAQRNIVGSLPFPPSSTLSKNSSPSQRGELSEEQQQQQQQSIDEDEMQTELYEKNFKKSNASRNSTSSWLGKSGLFDIDSTAAATTTNLSATIGEASTTSPNASSSKNTFKTRDDAKSQSISDDSEVSSSHDNNNGGAAIIKQQQSPVSGGERQLLLQEDYDEDESDEDACLDRSILINDKKNKKSKDDRDKNKTSKLAGGLSFRKKYNFDKL